MAPDPEISLRDFMEEKFKNLTEKFQDLEKRQEKLENEFDSLKTLISNDILHTIRIWKWISTLVAAIVIALATAWLKQRLGL